MKNKVIVASVDNIDAIVTAHGIGIKKVFVTGYQCDSNITQVAFGELKMNEEVESHQHPTMEEFYFFNEGEATFTINGEDFLCVSGTFVKIPAGISHGFKAITSIRFVYWGIAI